MVEILTENKNKALNSIAPFKTFTVKSQYKFGLSVSTKSLMEKRDKTRGQISKASPKAKIILQAKYRTLNRV